jgi:hypothetical protein
MSDHAGSAEVSDGRERRRIVGLFRLGRLAKNIWTFLGTNGGAAVSAVVGSAAVVGAMAVTTPELVGLEARERPGKLASARTVAPQTWDQTSLVFPLQGEDADGRNVLFDLVVLSRELAWVRGSDREIALSGKTLSDADIGTQVLGKELTAALAVSKEIITVGVASMEGAEAVEAERAARRAATAAGWVERVVPGGVPISTLSLGQFRTGCTGKIAGDSAWQRPLIVIAVRERQAHADVQEALANALSNKTNVPSPACYTRFEMRGVR